MGGERRCRCRTGTRVLLDLAAVEEYLESVRWENTPESCRTNALLLL